MTWDSLRQRVQRPYTAPRDGQALAITDVIPDAFLELWVRFSDGTWRHLDLAPLAEQPGFTPLRESFNNVYVGQHGLSLLWSEHFALPLSWLSGTPPGRRAGQMKVRTQGQGDQGWFRPLAAHVSPVADSRESERTVSRALALPRKDVSALLSAYAVPPPLAAQRLLDLLHYLARRQHCPLPEATQQLREYWAWGQYSKDPRVITPLEAIRHGRIALVERMVTTSASSRLITSATWPRPPHGGEEDATINIRTVDLAEYTVGVLETRSRLALAHGGGLYGQLTSPDTLSVSYATRRGHGSFPWAGEYVRGWGDGAEAIGGEDLHHVGFWLHVPEVPEDLDPERMKDILMTARSWFAQEAPPEGAVLLMVRDTPEGALDIQVVPLSRTYLYAEHLDVTFSA